MGEILQSIKSFFENPYVWATLAVLGFFGVTDWIKHLILQFLKETGRNFRDLINDKALRSSFYKWCSKHYRQLPPWAKKLSNWTEQIANKMGIKTRRRRSRNSRNKK